MIRDYEISKLNDVCRSCRREFQVDQEIVATLREADELFQREDYCPACWEACPDRNSPSVVAVWQAKVPRPQEKKKLFVDDELLVNLFERLDGTEESSRINFRFVLALVLMRKRLLVYDRMEKQPDGTETWLMHLKGDEAVHKLVNPKMDQEKTAEVSRSLSEILPNSGMGGVLGT
jgi:hypothetical protein